MNKNQIEGRRDGTSWHNTAKSTGSVVEVNLAVVQESNTFLPGEIPDLHGSGKSADAIVVGETSRSAQEHSKIAGGLTQRRAEPKGNVLTALRTVNPSILAVWRGDTESRSDGKHVDVQEQTSVSSSHGLAPCLVGTAVYGPVRTVVWDPWLAL
jgi:hypothetical protein